VEPARIPPCPESRGTAPLGAAGGGSRVNGGGSGDGMRKGSAVRRQRSGHPEPLHQAVLSSGEVQSSTVSSISSSPGGTGPSQRPGTLPQWSPREGRIGWVPRCRVAIESNGPEEGGSSGLWIRHEGGTTPPLVATTGLNMRVVQQVLSLVPRLPSFLPSFLPRDRGT